MRFFPLGSKIPRSRATGSFNPLLAPIGEHTLTFGPGYRISSKWRIDSGIEYSIKNEVTYTNPDLPFGTNAKETYEFIGAHFMLSRIW